MKKIIIPRKLEKGDKIGFFSPSSPSTVFAKKRFSRAKDYLEKMGFSLISGELTGKSDHYRSGSIKARVDELNSLIRNPEIKCIMSTTGGMNSNSLLPYIDYETLRKNPKIIVGFSDVTAILLAVYSQIGLVTYYGPALIASFGEFPPFVDETYRFFEDVVEKGCFPIVLLKPNYWTEEFIDWEAQNRCKTREKNHWVTINKGVARGRLIGGNLNTLEGMFGTKYMPEIRKGDILLIEDSLKEAADIERSFSMLKCAGIFARIGGLILGKHELFEDCESSRSPSDILVEVIGDELKFPILAEFDCCHTHPMFTIPLGGCVKLDATKQSVTIVNESYQSNFK